MVLPFHTVDRINLIAIKFSGYQVNILSGASGLFVLPVILAIVHGGSKVPEAKEKKSKVVDQPDS